MMEKFPLYVYGDNKSVLVNSSKPFSVLRKKSSSIAYLFVREGVSRDEWRVEYIPTNENHLKTVRKSKPFFCMNCSSHERNNRTIDFCIFINGFLGNSMVSGIAFTHFCHLDLN